MPFFIFIAGASGSGKSELAKHIKEELVSQNKSVGLLSMDDYYKPRPSNIVSEDAIKQYQQNTNFDTPSQFDFDLLHQHLNRLDSQLPIEKPVYSFKEGSTRLDYTETFEAADFIIIENIFALVNFGINPINKDNAYTIFIESENYDSYLARRLVRDPIERFFSTEHVLMHEQRFVRNGFFNFILPSRKHAEKIIKNEFLHHLSEDEANKSKEILENHGKDIAKEVLSKIETKNKMASTISNYLSLVYEVMVMPISQYFQFNHFFQTDIDKYYICEDSSEAVP